MPLHRWGSQEAFSSRCIRQHAGLHLGRTFASFGRFDQFVGYYEAERMLRDEAKLHIDSFAN